MRSIFFFSSRRRHTRSLCDWSSDVCSSDLRRLRRRGHIVYLSAEIRAVSRSADGFEVSNSATTLRIATRRSQLALWQAEHVASLLRQAHAGLEIELVPISTKGDRIPDRSLSAIGGRGLFIKEVGTRPQDIWRDSR